MAKKPKGVANEPEIEPDAWVRFERAVSVVVKSPPQPKKKKAATGRKRKKAKGTK
jgi:hypothetical protein